MSMDFYSSLVDQYLLERGNFDPVVFLVEAGLVDELQYRRWRAGEGALFDSLLCEEQEAIDALREAQQYCARQGLLSEPYTPTAWSSGAAVLNLGGSRAFQLLCSQKFSRSVVRRQADLFQDSAALVALQDTVRSLAEGKFIATSESLARMKQLRCDAADIDAMTSLLQAAKWLPSVNAAADRLNEMEQRIAPTARRYLQERSADYLAPLWRALAGCLPTSFQSNAPLLHQSYALFRAGDWHEVIEQVHAVEKWQQHDVLVIRLLQSFASLKQQAALRQTWSLLCWAHPDAAAYQLSRFTGDLALCNLWQAYCDSDAEDCDASDFPAWLLLADSKQLRYATSADATSVKEFFSREKSLQRYIAVYELVLKDCIANRAAVNQLSPWLLAEFLRRKVP